MGHPQSGAKLGSVQGLRHCVFQMDLEFLILQARKTLKLKTNHQKKKLDRQANGRGSLAPSRFPAPRRFPIDFHIHISGAILYRLCPCPCRWSTKFNFKIGHHPTSAIWHPIWSWPAFAVRWFDHIPYNGYCFTMKTISCHHLVITRNKDYFTECAPYTDTHHF